jgi:predicted RNase H-like HicB family nuclease
LKFFYQHNLELLEDGWITAECPSLPGCVSQGKDEKKATENIKEAIIAWLWADLYPLILYGLCYFPSFVLYNISIGK